MDTQFLEKITKVTYYNFFNYVPIALVKYITLVQNII